MSCLETVVRVDEHELSTRGSRRSRMKYLFCIGSVFYLDEFPKNSQFKGIFPTPHYIQREPFYNLYSQIVSESIMELQHRERSPFGVLIIHGFTATLDSVKSLYTAIEKLGIPVRQPLLAGHGALSPEALRGVRWESWMADAEQALFELSLEVEQVIVIGHSMGALLSLNLAARHKEKIDSLVLVAPAIQLISVLAPGRPLHFAAPFVSKIIKNWKLKSDFADQGCATCIPHYSWVPTDAIISFFELIKISQQLLGRVNVPVLIMHNRRENTVRPESALILYNRIATEPSGKSIIWLEHSGHQIFCDCESEKAVKAIMDYVVSRIGQKRGRTGDAGH